MNDEYIKTVVLGDQATQSADQSLGNVNANSEPSANADAEQPEPDVDFVRTYAYLT